MVQEIVEKKLNLFGHICRMKDNRLVKEVMFGMMEGETRRGRPGRDWFDDIKEWCEEEIHTQQEGAGSRHVENKREDGIGHLRHPAHGAMDGCIGKQQQMKKILDRSEKKRGDSSPVLNKPILFLSGYIKAFDFSAREF